MSLARNLSVAIATVLAVLIIGLLVLRRGAPTPAATEAAGPTDETRRNAELGRFQQMARTEPGSVADVFRLLIGEPAAA